MKRRFFAAVMIGTLLCSVSFGATLAASFQGLGDLPGAEFYSEAYGISGDGRVVVGASQSVVPPSYSSPANEAFYWTQATGMIGMGDFPGGKLSSQAKAASTNGNVIVGHGKPDSPSYEAFRWTAETGLAGLGYLPEGSQYTQALDVSVDGSVVVGVGEGELGSEAFRWTESTGIVGLGHLPGGSGSFFSIACAVSADGSVIIGEDTSTGSYQPFIWTAETGMQIIPGYSTNARDISGNGQVVVLDMDSGSYSNAYRWTAVGGEEKIGNGRIYATNWDGSVIVGSNNDQAFIWDSENGMRNLKDYLITLSCFGMVGWNSTTATGISDDGTVIVGYGTNPKGKREAWMASVPAISHSNLVGQWKFDEISGTVAKDSIGTADGILRNGPLWAEGIIKGGLSFDGIDDYVEITGRKGISGGYSRTCMAWIKTLGTGQNSGILSWGGNTWIFGLFGTGELIVYAGGPYIQTTMLVNDDQWHHVAAVMKNDGTPNTSEIKLYVDGVIQITTQSPGAIYTPQSNDVLVGSFSSSGTPAAFFKGLIDDIQINDTALNENEIKDMAHIPFEYYGGGAGTATNPYQIRTPEQMNTIGANSADWGKCFKLMADIDMSVYTGTQYNIIGELLSPFTGTFDGNGHVVSNLTSTTENETLAGFFGCISNATIKNLGLENINVYSGQSCAGGLAGYQQESTIINCYTTGTVRSLGITNISNIPEGAGGLVGFQYAGMIIDCHSTVSVSCSKYAGGLVGYGQFGMISNCYSAGNVTSSSHAGGLVGRQSEGTLVNCNSMGMVTVPSSAGAIYVGGLVGFHAKGTISKCFSTGIVGGTSDYVSYAGGLTGLTHSGTITDCYNAASVSSSSATSIAAAGGLVGYLYHETAKIKTSYSTGKATATGARVYKGGLMGYGVSADPNCFWDTQTSGLNTSAGGIGKTTAQMKTQSTFASAGWDFVNTWCMNGYPALKWEINPLQARIDAALNGDTLVVQPGVYEGRLYFKGKNITLTSTNPQDPNIVASTIIRGRGIGPVVTFQGTETPDCVLQGFTIEGGRAPLPGGGGIFGGPAAAAMATIRNCVIQNNNTTDYGGAIGGVKGLISNCILRNNSAKYGGGLSWCDGRIENCLIVNNTATTAGNALHHCNGQILNCTIVSDNNLAVSQINSCAGSFSNSILDGQMNVFDACTGAVTYSCYPGATGTGNIAANPLFVNTDPNNLNNSDYHLLPDSPCIDAGNPASEYSQEPWPNGSRIDMGAYGNTSQATNSRDGLVPLGLMTVNKTRVGRTTFEYELAVMVRNSNTYDMTDVQMQLKDWDAAVLSVSDDAVTIDTIPAGATVTSADTFTLVIDRSTLILPGRLTWELTYYVPASGGQMQQATLSMPLSAIDAIPGDITGDGEVDFGDLAILADQWLQPPGTPSADMAPSPVDGQVNVLDFAVLAEHWLE